MREMQADFAQKIAELMKHKEELEKELQQVSYRRLYDSVIDRQW